MHKLKQIFLLKTRIQICLTTSDLIIFIIRSAFIRLLLQRFALQKRRRGRALRPDCVCQNSDTP